MTAALILLAAAALSLYLLVGYPLRLRAWRRLKPPIQKDFNFTTTATVLMAVYNGEAFIARRLDNLLALDYPAELLDIVVVSDGSTDATDRIVESYAERKVQLVKVPHGGKPAALNAGLQHARGELLLFADVRQVFDSKALRHLVANFADLTVGCVTGELRYVHSHNVGEAADIDLYWRYEIWARQRHSAIDSMFNTTGCVYAIRRELAEPIPSDTLIDDAVIPLRAFFRGYRVVIDTDALAFDYGVVKGGEFRRKLRQLSGTWQTWARMPQLFSSTNRMRTHFLPHKVGRVILPWLILVGLAATWALPDGPVRTALLGIAALVLALAALDLLLPKTFALRRISSPARSFVALNAASLLSVAVFFVPAERLWRPTHVAPGAADTLLPRQSENKS
ncbi:MAG TPA: glycosyltransferase family 2 protein [Candidatus Angelobacter sp.]|jgi:cellulose synthase/poly-beta-1,6-N-acetylglucosamine synthase-like glycosyltransferase|nr:glycosyltransferase family 2 protein [Candidatus Angelobacter sp.]